MGFQIYQDYASPTVFRSVLQDTARVNVALSMDLNNPLGETTFTCVLFDEFDEEGNRFKPRLAQRVRWIADDGSGTALFDGFVKTSPSKSFGRNELGAEILQYTLNAKDPSWLWEKKQITPGTFSNFKPGELIYTLANSCDARFLQASDNDTGHSVGDIELGLISYKEAIIQIAQSAGLMVWVDQNWYVHCKKWSTIIGLGQESKFNISDSNKIYSNLNLEPDCEKLCTRIHVIGSQMDSGTKNAENRKQGKQKREDNVVTRTATIDLINLLRSRLGVEALPLDTDVESLPNSTPGIFEDRLECQDVYDEATLIVIANTHLEMYATELLRGSVEFRDAGLIPGRSIYINSETRDEEAYLPVIELEIKSNGFDAGNKSYLYTAYVNGPSEVTQMARDLEPPTEVKVKAEALIKPNYATFNGATTREVNAQLNVSGAVIRADQ